MRRLTDQSTNDIVARRAAGIEPGFLRPAKRRWRTPSRYGARSDESGAPTQALRRAVALTLAALTSAALGGCGDGGSTRSRHSSRRRPPRERARVPGARDQEHDAGGRRGPDRRRRRRRARGLPGRAPGAGDTGRPERLAGRDRGRGADGAAAALPGAAHRRPRRAGRDVGGGRHAQPRGAQEAGGAQVLRIGKAGAPGGVRTTSIDPGDPARRPPRSTRS